VPRFVRIGSFDSKGGGVHSLVGERTGGGANSDDEEKALYSRNSIIPIRLKMLMSTPGLRIRIHFIQIRIQHFRLNTDPDPIRIQGFNDQKMEKVQLKKKITFYLDQKLQFTYP
jgi:hypothetical protein